MGMDVWNLGYDKPDMLRVKAFFLDELLHALGAVHVLEAFFLPEPFA